MSLVLAVIILVLLILYVITLYNNIVRRRNDVDKAFGSIDAMLKKRYDLIPNLVEVVKQYAQYESSVFTEITKLRSQLGATLSVDEQVTVHNNLTKQLNGMMLTVENYPGLKANQNFIQLQGAWNDTEEQIAAARRYYNAAVTEYNNSIQTFPANILVDAAKYSPKKVLEVEETERQNISAKDLFKAN